MKAGLNKKLFLIILFTTIFASMIFVPQAQALNSSYGDQTLNYLVVSATPDVVKLGQTVTVTITARLPDNLNTTDIFHIKIFADTISEPAKVISQGDLVLVSITNATSQTAEYAVTVPSDAIANTYLYATINDNTRMYSRIALSLIQTSTYPELQSRINTVQAQNNDLQSANNTNIMLLYIVTGVAALFIMTTFYILSLTLRAKKSNTTPTSPA